MKKADQTHKSSPSGEMKWSKSLQGKDSSSDIISRPETDDGHLKDPRKNKGTRYITEDLIQKWTKCDRLGLVRTLDLSASVHSNAKRFRYIEHLDKCEHLQVLNLGNNTIEKIEKLEKLSRLRELHLSNNAIQKIEGLEHMANLQILNLACNNIEHLPIWLAKKLRSLHTINLQSNKIFSLHEVVKLKPLKNLTSLTLAENPVAALAHYHLFLIFHLRSLEILDGQPISPQERDEAHQRFHMEEVVRLEQELELRSEEISRLQREQMAASADLERQERANHNLRQENHEQQRSLDELTRELDTKSELPALSAPLLDSVCQLKQKTVELTRACQKHYELEQELAFHKIDAKFEPLPFRPDPAVEMENLSTESPYIGKARQRRNITFASEDKRARGLKQDVTETDNPASDDIFRHAQLRAEERLQQLHEEIEEKEQQILKASEELRQLEITVSQRKICEAEKDEVRQELQRRIQRLGALRDEMKMLEKQLDRQDTEKSEALGKMEQLQSILDGLDPSDPRYAHVKAQLSRTTQLLAIMSRKHQELEGRLDDMITRIHNETQEIKELEQQLTDGQIAANEALKRDLEGIITGLQEYLQGVKDQARRAQSECRRLQKENDALRSLLHEKDLRCMQLETETQSAKSCQEELKCQQQELEDLRKENEDLRLVQGQISEYETELQERDAEATQLKDQLDRLRRLSQMELSALQAELQKERQAKENVLTRMQMAADRELENTELLHQVNTLQEEKDFLKERVDDLQDELKQVRDELLCPARLSKHLKELKRSIAVGQKELSFEDLGEAVNKSLKELQLEVHRVVSAAQRDRDEAQQSQDALAGEINSLKERLRMYQEKYQMERNQKAAERHDEEEELQRLREELEDTHEQQYVMLKHLEDTEVERDRLLAELEEQDTQMKAEDSQAQEQLESLTCELQKLRRSVSSADRMAAQQLNAAKDKLHSLHSTIEKIHSERSAKAEELESTKLQAAQAIQDLNKAEDEIQVLQKLLIDRLNEADGKRHSVSNPSQHQELNKLNQTLKKQQAQTKRLRDQLAQANEANNENLQELLKEIETLRATLLQQNNYLSSLGDPTPNAGCWYYVPSHPNAPSLGSQGTQDSGLGSVHPHSLEKGRRPRFRAQRDSRPPVNGGYWVYSPHPHTHARREAQMFRDSGRESDVEDPSTLAATSGITVPSAGSVMYDHPIVPGHPIGSSTVLYGPAPDGARLVYGLPPSSLTVPLVPSGTLHCNVPGHRDLERDLNNAERRLRDEHDDRVQNEKEQQKLQEKTADLQWEIKRLRKTVHTLKRHTSTLKSSTSHTEDEHCVSGEVQCVEKTLLKRRAELREADRLLLEAETELKDTREKTQESMQYYNEARRRVEETERELVEMDQRAQTCATQLVHTKQQLRDLQEEVLVLQKRKQEQEHTLEEVQEIIAHQDVKFQEVSRKLERATDSLEAVQNEIKETQDLEANLLQSCRLAENNLTQRQTQLDQISDQVELQKKELSLLDRKLEQWKQEEAVLRFSMEKHRQGLLDVLRQGEEDVHSLHQRIQELRVDVQTLAVQKGELDSQLSERKSRLAQYKTDQQEEEETLQDLRSAVNKHKAELKHVLEMVHLETTELEGLKIQHKQKLHQLEKGQETLLQVGVELQRLQEELQEQNGEAERQKNLLEKERAELQALQQQNLDLERQTETAVRERSSLQEQCKNLEARRMHAQRCLNASEKAVRTAETELLRRQTELEKHQRDQNQAHELQQEINRDVAAKLQDEVNRLKKELVDSQIGLDEIRGEIKIAKKQQDDLVTQHMHEKLELEEKIRRRQQKLDKLGLQLQELKEQVMQKQKQLEKQDKLIRVQQQESSDLEQLHRLKQQSLQAVEGALALRLEQFAVTETQDNAQLQGELLTVEKGAQENHKQARTLQKHLSTLSQETPGFKDTETMPSVRSRVRADVDSDGLRELESPSSLSSDTDSLKENHPCVEKPGYNTQDEQWRGEALRERLRQQEDHLKVQLRRRMFSQQEALSQRRLQAEGSILGLRRHVDKLDQLLSNSTKDSSYSSDQEDVFTKNATIVKPSGYRDEQIWLDEP